MGDRKLTEDKGEKPDSERRRLAAIMFTDIVGYTAMTQENERMALRQLDEHRNLLRSIFRKQGGREINAMGDAFLVEFESSLQAVECAITIQSALHGQSQTLPPERGTRVRIGIHIGDVIYRGHDVYGDAVNIASRIEKVVTGEGTYISQNVADDVRRKIDRPLLRLGKYALKNVATPMEVYKIVMPWEKSTSPQERTAEDRLAVLPFTNMSPDPQDAFFADGITEEIISTASKIKGLSVISRTSVMRYRQSTKSTMEIGQELNARMLLEGSVRKAGGRVRIAVQLIDAEKDQHIWAETYDRELQDIFAIQSDVASKVAGILSKVVPKEDVKSDTDDIEAYTLYIRAIQLYHQESEDTQREAVALFEKAIARDPNFVRAYAGLAHAFCGLVFGGYEDFAVFVPKAEAAARRALELGPNWAESHAAMAVVDGAMDRFEEEAAEAEEAVRINPNISEAYYSLGFCYSGIGKVKEGLRALRRACELDPLSLDAGFLRAMVAAVSGEEREAMEVLTKLKELSPRNPRVFLGLADAYLNKGDFARAQRAIDDGLRINPNEPTLKVEQGILYAMSGRRKEAETMLKETSSNKNESARLFGEVHINAILGNLDEAFAGLMRQADLHSWWFLIHTDPKYEKLRSDPRYAEFCKKVGLSN